MTHGLGKLVPLRKGFREKPSRLGKKSLLVYLQKVGHQVHYFV